MQVPPHSSVPKLITGAVTPQALRGFTLIEVLVVIAIMGVLAAIAGPSFTPTIERWRVKQAAEAITSTIYYARSEAIKRDGGISIKAKTDANWASGWQVLFNNNGTKEVLQNTDPFTQIDISLADGDGIITIDRWGQMKSATKSTFDFRLIPHGTSTANSNAIALCIGLGGRIKRTKTGSEECS